MGIRIYNMEVRTGSELKWFAASLAIVFIQIVRWWSGVYWCLIVSLWPFGSIHETWTWSNHGLHNIRLLAHGKFLWKTTAAPSCPTYCSTSCTHVHTQGPISGLSWKNKVQRFILYSFHMSIQLGFARGKRDVLLCLTSCILGTQLGISIILSLHFWWVWLDVQYPVRKSSLASRTGALLAFALVQE